MALKSVGSIFGATRPPWWCSPNPVSQTPKDLEGKSIAITAGSAQFQQLPAFVKGAGIDGAKIEVVNIDPAGVTACPCHWPGAGDRGLCPGLRPERRNPQQEGVRVFWYADYGVTAVSNSIIVHDDLLKSDPELGPRFCRADDQGLSLCAGSIPTRRSRPCASTWRPPITDIARREPELSWKTWVTPNTQGKPLGWASEADWAETVKCAQGIWRRDRAAIGRSLYTNALVPTGAEYVPPQA